MSTSGTVSFNLTALEIIEKAFGRLGKNSEGMSLSAKMYEDGRSSLNLLLKSNLGTMEHLFTKTERSVTLVTDTSAYILTPKPGRVLSVRLRFTSGDNITDIPLTELSRADYYDLPLRAGSSSTPNSWYYDPQTSAGTLYLWPPPSAASITAGYSLQLTYLRRIEDMVGTADDLDMPQEWMDPVIWLLADDLETEYPVGDARLAMKIEAKARESRALLKSWDTEPGSIYLQPEYDPWRS
jgi:hypothetical protein